MDRFHVIIPLNPELNNLNRNFAQCAELGVSLDECIEIMIRSINNYMLPNDYFHVVLDYILPIKEFDFILYSLIKQDLFKLALNLTTNVLKVDCYLPITHWALEIDSIRLITGGYNECSSPQRLHGYYN